MRNYTILTSKSLLETTEENEMELFMEQMTLLQNGFYAVHILENNFSNEDYVLTQDLLDLCQYLAIKEGIDVVKFDNGMNGILAYYGSEVTTIEYKEISENEFDYYIDNEEKINELF